MLQHDNLYKNHHDEYEYNMEEELKDDHNDNNLEGGD
jgi:hypothetical protein